MPFPAVALIVNQKGCINPRRAEGKNAIAGGARSGDFRFFQGAPAGMLGKVERARARSAQNIANGRDHALPRKIFGRENRTCPEKPIILKMQFFSMSCLDISGFGPEVFRLGGPPARRGARSVAPDGRVRVAHEKALCYGPVAERGGTLDITSHPQQRIACLQIADNLSARFSLARDCVNRF